MLGIEQSGMSWRIVTVVLPVAVYFFILGFLNSRRRPLVLTGRTDFVLMIAALSPLFACPLLGWLGMSAVSLVAVVAALAGAIGALAPRGPAWVIYNLPLGQATTIIERTLRSLGVPVRPQREGFRLADREGGIHVSGFSLLRNVSVRLEGQAKALAGPFEDTLRRMLATTETDTTPAALAMLMAAIAMMVVPLALVAQQVPQIVRILTDLLP